MSQRLRAAGTARRFLTLIWRPGDIREVRIPKHNTYGHTASGYFDDAAKLAQAVSQYDGRANIYVTLNPVNPDLLARASNRILQRVDKTTADVDVVQRRWMLIDVDATRPSGISSTDQELRAAKTVLDSATSWLTEEGWPAPITAMSGNGYYALYAVDLPNDAVASALVQGVLSALASRFNTGEAHVDTTVSNPARIAGVVGTLKVKGDSTEQRPHRRSRLESVPDKLSPVPLDLLERIAECGEAAEQPSPAERHAGKPWVLRDILDQHQIEYREQPPDQHGVTWYHVRQCPLHDDGRAFECGVGQKLPDGPFAGKCFHPEGANRGWQEFKNALGIELCRNGRFDSPDAREPRGPAAITLRIDSLADILSEKDDELEVVIGDGRDGAVLPIDGKGFIAGPTGIGKTNLLLRLGRCLAEGTPFLGLPIPRPRRVLHLALEGSRRGLRRRLKKIWEGADPEARTRFHMVMCQINLAEEYEIWRLHEALARVHPDVVIIDPARNAHPWDENSSQEMARLTGVLDNLIARHHCAIVAAHHDRKRPPFTRRDAGTDRVRGSTALTGWLSFCLSVDADPRNADTLFADWTKLRDAEEPLLPLTLEFDRDTIDFLATARATLTKLTEETVLTAVLQAGGSIRGTDLIGGLVEACGVSDRTCRDRMRVLVKNGRLHEFVAPADRQIGAKSYRLPDDEEVLP